MRFALFAPNIQSILKNIPHALEQNIYSVVLGDMFYKRLGSSWIRLLFK